MTGSPLPAKLPGVHPATKAAAGSSARPDARFPVCVARLLAREGGLSTARADRGGVTNFGISLRFLVENADSAVVRDIIGHDGPPNESDVRALTRGDAETLYRVLFWRANSCGALPPTLDGAVFDECVNGGGAALLQTTLNLFFHGHLVVDGAIGPGTLALVARAVADPSVGVDRLLVSYRSVAENRYRAIVRADASQKPFLAGWIARARSLGDV